MNEHKTIAATENEIVEEFSLFDSWDDKYEYIIDLGKKLEPLDEKYKIDENRVRGCQSTVYLTADYNDGKIFFKADSDAVIVKGLISMLIRVLSGQKTARTLCEWSSFLAVIIPQNRCQKKQIGSCIHFSPT